MEQLGAHREHRALAAWGVMVAGDGSVAGHLLQ